MGGGEKKYIYTYQNFHLTDFRSSTNLKKYKQIKNKKHTYTYYRQTVKWNKWWLFLGKKWKLYDIAMRLQEK